MPHNGSQRTLVKPWREDRVLADRVADPIYLVDKNWNALVGALDVPRLSEEPSDDGRSYEEANTKQKLCRPFVKVAWRVDWLPGPELRFVQRDDGLYLAVALEEDFARRVPNTLPFGVSVQSIKLDFGTNQSDTLDFREVLQIPGAQDAVGPDFRVEAEARVPLEQSACIIDALQAGDAWWRVEMMFRWQKVSLSASFGDTSPTGPVPGPVVIGGSPFLLPGHSSVMRTIEEVVARESSTIDATSARARPLLARRLRFYTAAGTRRQMMDISPDSPLQTMSILRKMQAHYPPTTPENRAIYAAVDKNYVEAGWRNSAYGWYRPTALQDTVYCIPDVYRIRVNSTTGLPAIQAILLRKGADAIVDDLDPTFYRTRLTIGVCPDFNIDRLDKLRDHVRGASNGQVKYADLVFGGYGRAQFLADDSLAGLGQLFAGETAENQELINPETGFAVTYEGNAEFMQMVYEKLKGAGIGGYVQVDLMELDGSVRQHLIPVEISLRKPASLDLPMALQQSPTSEAADSEQESRHIYRIDNPTDLPVRIDNILGAALERSPITGEVRAWYEADLENVTIPIQLAPKESGPFTLRVHAAGTNYNCMNVLLVNPHVEISQPLMLQKIFDLATGGVRAWKVDVTSPPLKYYDELSDEDKAKLSGVKEIEVEVRRPGSNQIEEVKLTKDKPDAFVLLTRTVADFFSDQSTALRAFEFRKRLLFLTEPGKWSDWTNESGNSVTIYVA